MRPRGDRNHESAVRIFVCAVSFSAVVSAQAPDTQAILQRLDRLEAQNQELMAEIRALRQQLAPPAQAATQAAPPAEPAEAVTQQRIEVQQQQVAQLDQEKISSDHRLPLTLTGTLLFNTYWTGAGGGGADNPTTAPPGGPQSVSAGATFRQSVVGV